MKSSYNNGVFHPLFGLKAQAVTAIFGFLSDIRIFALFTNLVLRPFLCAAPSLECVKEEELKGGDWNTNRQLFATDFTSSSTHIKLFANIEGKLRLV